VTLDADIGVDIDAFSLDVSLTVAEGCVLALVGPNGAGKTSALRAIAGLRPLDRGEVCIDGHTVDAPARDVFVVPERRQVGVMFQDYLLFPHLSAMENVAFGLRARRTRRAEARATAMEWLERLGVADRASAKPAELSGGQAQRVALARALAIEPKVLLLDEPLAALDAGARDDVRRDLAHHLRDFAGAVVLVSHDPVDAAVLGDEIAILDGGRLAQRGAVGDVLAHPRSRYVADLVGVNLLEGRGEGHEVMLAGGGRVVVADAVTGTVQVVIDPRAVAISNAPINGSPRNLWPARVDSVESIGDRARVRLAGEVPLVAEVTTAAVEDLGLRGGTEVWASVKATEVQVSPR
jgi:molybdate transport system ATP-binding protein